MPSPVEFADTLRMRIDIVDVVGGYVQLKPAGANHKGCCPFHKEKTPSFTVHREKQIFHCFGCSKGGDAIRFVMDIEHLSWMDSVRFLADKYGIAVPNFSNRTDGATNAQTGRDRREQLIEISKFAEEFFCRQLARELANPNTEAAQYMAKRGLDADLCTRFKLGLSPVKGWDVLLRNAAKQKFDKQVVIDAGLAIEREDRLYDRFRNRIMFPIHDTSGRAVAFGGRVYHSSAAEDDPKYINSPETELYSKGQQLYAFHLARPAIKEQNAVMLMEGYLDVIRCHQFGLTNAVASCGTALTEDQGRLLRRFTKRAILVYDGDSAGQKAMLRAAEILLPMEFELRFAVLPNQHDPDSFLREHGAETFQKLINSSANILQFLMRVAEAQNSPTTPEGKQAIVAFIAPFFARIPAPVLRDEYVRLLADYLSLSTASITEVLRGVAAGQSAHNAASRVLDRDFRREEEPRNEILLMKLFVELPGLRPMISTQLKPEWLQGARVRALFDVFMRQSQLEVESAWGWNSVLEICPDEVLRQITSRIAVTDFPELNLVQDETQLSPMVILLIKRLAHQSVKQQEKRIRHSLKSIENSDEDAELADRRLQEFDHNARKPFTTE